MQLLLCTTAMAEAPSEPAGAGNEPRDGEEPLWSFPTYPWTDSPPHNPVPKFPNYTQAFNLLTVSFVPPFLLAFQSSRSKALLGRGAEKSFVTHSRAASWDGSWGW